MEQKTRYYRVRPDLSLVDESAIFRIDEKPFCIYDQNNAVFHYCDRDDYQFGSYLREWRNEQELRDMVSANTVFAGREWSTYVAAFRNMHLLEESESEARTNLDSHDKAVLFIADPIPYKDDAVRPRGFPTSISLNVTTACNLRCLHCSQEAGDGQAVKHLPLDVVLDLLDQFEACALWDLRLSGGEPACHPELTKILDGATKRRYGVTLFTNGTILTPALRDAIVRIARAKPTFRVHLSIDGACAETHDWLRDRPGTFDKLKQFMEFLRSEEVPWLAESVVTRRSLGELGEIVALVCDYGARVITFHVSSMVGRATKAVDDLLLDTNELKRLQEVGDDLAMRYVDRLYVNPANVTLPDAIALPERIFRKRLLALMMQNQSMLREEDEVQRLAALSGVPPYGYARRHRFCTAGVTQLAIEGDGSAYACPYLATRPDWSAGNVLEQDVLSIWKSEKLLFFRGGWNYPDLHVCRQCTRQKECRLPQICRVSPLVSYNDAYGPGPECVLKYKELSSGLPDELWESIASKLH